MRSRTRDTFKTGFNHVTSEHDSLSHITNDSVQTTPKWKNTHSNLLLRFLAFLLILRLHGLANILKVFLNVVYDLHSCLRDPGSRAEYSAHAALVQELIVLQGEGGGFGRNE